MVNLLPYMIFKSKQNGKIINHNNYRQRNYTCLQLTLIKLSPS